MNQFAASLWGDEAFSAILSLKSIPEIIKTISRDTSPPLYNITEHLWFQAFGTSEIAIRSLSFFYYLIAIIFVFLIARHYFGGKTAVIASLLTFLNPFFFRYAFEGRMYSILAMTITASMYFFITRRWLLYIVATVAALYSHHFAIFAVFTQGLWFIKKLVWGNRKLSMAMFKSFIAVGVLYLPWLPIFYKQTKMVASGFWLGTPTVTDLGNLVFNYIAQGSSHPLAKPALYLSLIILVLRVWGKDLNKIFFLALWFFTPILVTFLTSQKFQSIFYDRYLLYTIPAAMIILSSNLRKFSKVLVLGLISLFLIIDLHYFTHPTKLPFRELASYIKETKRGDDYLINWNSSAHHLWESKYYGVGAPIYIPQEKELPFYVGTALMTEADIVREIPARLPAKVKLARVGVITSGPVEEVTIPGFALDEVKEFGSLKAVWMIRK